VSAIDDVHLHVEQGELVTILGPSGSGKTTLLTMIAGLNNPSAGRIDIGGRDVTFLPAARRNVGLVFQSYALFPHMSVYDNVAFPLSVRHQDQAEIRRRVAEALRLVRLAGFERRRPSQLSGGQQQRVALARALAVRPKVLLLDEPLSALDAKIRVSLREEIRAIQRELGITTIYVTHDQEEALAMSDRIVVMHDGVAEQIGDPFEIYNRPATRFVASFVGTLNVLTARLQDPATGRVSVDGQEILLGQAVHGNAGEEVHISLRPQAVHIGSRAQSDATLRGRVDSVSFLGSVVRIRVILDGQDLSADVSNPAAMRPPRSGEAVEVGFATGDVLVLEGALD
jgi:putative spermidine/putrescine transport system ATP-binding protein